MSTTSTAPVEDAPTGAPAPDPTPTAPAASIATRREQARRRRRTSRSTTKVDRVDRVLLALIGLLAMAVGVVALLAAEDELDLRQPRSLYRDATASAVDHQELWTAGAIAGGVIIGLLGLWWAWAQIRPRPERGRLGPTVLARGRSGRTSVAPAPIARALAADVALIDGVADASARVVALDAVAEVLLSIELQAGADVRAVRAAVEGPLARMAGAVGAEAVDAELRLRFGRDPLERVR